MSWVVSWPVQRMLITCVESTCAMIGPCWRTIRTWNGTSEPPRTLMEYVATASGTPFTHGTGNPQLASVSWYRSVTS